MTPRRADSGAAEHHVADSPVGAAHQLTSSSRRAEEARSHHSGKFRAAVAVLIVLGAVALALAVGLTVSRGRGTSSGGDWSQWKPQDSGLAGAQEIADFVSPYLPAASGCPAQSKRDPDSSGQEHRCTQQERSADPG